TGCVHFENRIYSRRNFADFRHGPHAHVAARQRLAYRSCDLERSTTFVHERDELILVEMAGKMTGAGIGRDTTKMAPGEWMLPHQRVHGRRQYDRPRGIPSSPDACQAIIT